MKRVLILILAVAVVSGAFAGGTKEAAPAGGKQLVMGVSIAALFPAIQFAVAGVQRMCELEGIKLIYSVADGDATKQNQQVQSLINQKVDVLLIYAVDKESIITVCEQAAAKGIPVISWLRAIDSPAISYTLDIDPYNEGATCAQYLKSKNDGKPHVILEQLGALNDINAILRREGFEDTLQSEKNLKIVQGPTDWDPAKAQAVVANALTEYPDLWAVQIPSDHMTESTVTAIEEAGRLKKAGEPGHVIVTAIDGSAPKALMEKNIDCIAVISYMQIPAITVLTAEKLARGESMLDKKYQTHSTLYTWDKLAEQTAKYGKIWGTIDYKSLATWTRDDFLAAVK